MAKDKKTDTLNKGHKHLFGSTEKSDFILNMDFDGAQKMCSRFCMLAVLIISLVLIPAYYTQHIEMYVEENMPHYLGDNFIFYSASMVMLMADWAIWCLMLPDRRVWSILKTTRH